MLSTLLVETTEELAPLIAPAWVFAAIAAAIFIVLGFVTYSYRDVANRHSDKASAQDAHGDASGRAGGGH
ncbi:MAG: hypothetical protein DI534_12340 [Leifsonia xyli]|nr:MAG: hypothetical protein DI534_12340 [Leifsonia xyli]